MSKTEILYKTLPKNKTPHGHKWTLNKWHKIEGDLKICSNGFHASRNIIDAMRYVTPWHVAVVEVRGESEKQADKEAWGEMRIIKWAKWTKKDSVSLAIFAAELCIEKFEKEFPDDKRPRDAIEAAKAVLKRDTKVNRSAARSAANAAWSAASAVRSAANAARSAEWSAASAANAARSAEWSAANAARSAANAAWSAARSAARSAANAARSAEWSAASAANAAWSAAWSAANAASVRKEYTQKCHAFAIERKELNHE